MSRLKAVYSALAISGLLLTGCTIPTLKETSPTTMAPIATQLHTHHWTLQRALGAANEADNQWFVHSTPTRPARTVQLDFESNQRLHIARLCNSMNASYQTQGNTLQISSVVGTLMACPDTALMQLEQKVGAMLPQATSWNIQNDTLEIQFKDGQRWQFHGNPKYSVLYGQPERIFLEIAPQTSTCHLPNMRDAQCLQVRSVHYDEQGIKKHTGAWEHFYGSIEGYTHQEGTRSIVRLNRYTRTNAPADASRFIYVHDMTVESGTAR